MVVSAPDGSLLANADWDGDVWLWSIDTCQPVGAPLKGHKSSAGPVAFSADGKTLVTGGDDGTIRWWHVATCKEMLWFEDVWITDPWFVPQATFNPGGNVVALAREHRDHPRDTASDAGGGINRLEQAPGRKR